MNPVIKEKLQQTFEDHIPNSLYYTYQELSEHLGSTPRTWENFLDQPDIQRLIEQKLNKYMQIDARKALNRLANDPNLSSHDISALKHLIENSHLLKQKAETKQHILVVSPSLNNHQGGTDTQ